MRIGIDISQVVYRNTGVARYVRQMVRELIALPSEHEYVLVATAFRRKQDIEAFYDEIKRIDSAVRLVIIPVPPKIAHIIWNVLHVAPVEWFTGRLDVFWSSDWTQPPLLHAKGVTTIHDVAVLHYPDQFHTTIQSVQKHRLRQVKHECEVILCDSEATRSDVVNLLGIEKSKTTVVYPGRGVV